MAQLGTGLRSGLAMLVAVGLLGMAGGAHGQALPDVLARAGEVQVVAASSTTRTFGTANLTAHVIGAAEFDPLSGGATWAYTDPGLAKFSSFQLVASVRLPAGALVDLWCPIAYLPHVLLGHILPRRVAAAFGAWGGRRLVPP